MILRFKPESEAEKAVKELIAHRNKTAEYAKDIVENAIGIRPFGFGYSWFFGVSYSWDCNMTGFDKTVQKEIEGMTFVKEQSDGLRVYKPNKRNKTGKLIAYIEPVLAIDDKIIFINQDRAVFKEVQAAIHAFNNLLDLGFIQIAVTFQETE